MRLSAHWWILHASRCVLRLLAQGRNNGLLFFHYQYGHFVLQCSLGDQYRDMAFPLLQGLSLPYAEIGYDGKVCVSKAEGSGGILNTSTCAEQLLYEIADPSAYITPDVVS